MTEPQTTPQNAQQKESAEEDKFRFEAVYLLPILASLLFGLGCSFILSLKPEDVYIPPPTPFEEGTPGAPIGNAIYFVVLLAVAATVFYFLLKRKNKRIIKILIVTAITTASLLLSFFYLYSILVYFAPDLLDWAILLPLMIVVAVLVDLAVFKLGSKARNTAIILLGGALGVFFGSAIPWWSAVAILIFLAAYDVIAVYKGPVGKIAQSGLDDLQGLSFSFKDIQMGLGDLVFYSMLMGLMFKTFSASVFPALAAIVGIMAGSVVTFYMLERKGLFPGLPFPIIIGLGAGFGTALALGLSVPIVL
jgi:presenilin-like A22 family membrane protease